MPPCDTPLQEHLRYLELAGKTCTACHNDLEFLCIGTAQGDVLLYHKDFPLPYASYTPASSPITALACEGSLLACGDREGNVFLYNHTAHREIARLRLSAHPVHNLLFVNPYTLVIFFVGGETYRYTLSFEPHAIKTRLPFATVRFILPFMQNTYALLQVDEANFALFDLAEHKLCRSKFLTTPFAIKTCHIEETTLYIEYQNNRTDTFDLCPTGELDSLLLHNALEQADVLVRNNPVLCRTPSFEKLSRFYDAMLQDALQALIKQNKERFERILEMFGGVAAKKEEIALLKKTYEHYPRFIALVEAKKYPLAYAMGAKLPHLQATPPYKKLQESFSASTRQAQKALLGGAHAKAREILSPFMGIASKRDTTKLFLEKNTIFLSFLKALEEKDYATCQTLVAQEKSLAKLPNYIALQNTQESCMQEIYKAVLSFDLPRAKEQLAKLPASQPSDSLQELMCGVERLGELYENNDFNGCYELLDTYPLLAQSELGILLEKHWRKTLAKAREHAIASDINAIQNVLGELILAASKEKSIASLFKLGFYAKIEALLKKKEYKSAEGFIYSYLDLFGEDLSIAVLMKLFALTAPFPLALSQNEHPPKGWKGTIF